MRDVLLTNLIADTISDFDHLVELHYAAEQHDVALQRLAFVQHQFIEFASALASLRTVVMEQPAHESLWQATCIELRTLMPPTLIAPAQALITGNLDLLTLVAYTSASLRIVHDRLAIIRAADNELCGQP